MTTHQFALTIACLVIIGGALIIQSSDHTLPWWMLMVFGLGPLVAMAFIGGK